MDASYQEHRLLFYYGFTDETQLEAVPNSDAIYEDKRSNISEIKSEVTVSPGL